MRFEIALLDAALPFFRVNAARRCGYAVPRPPNSSGFISTRRAHSRAASGSDGDSHSRSATSSISRPASGFSRMYLRWASHINRSARPASARSRWATDASSRFARDLRQGPRPLPQTPTPPQPTSHRNPAPRPFAHSTPESTVELSPPKAQRGERLSPAPAVPARVWRAAPIHPVGGANSSATPRATTTGTPTHASTHPRERHSPHRSYWTYWSYSPHRTHWPRHRS